MGSQERRGGGGCSPPMDLMRSEEMQLVQLIIPMESAHVTVSYLGDFGLLQFKDLNADKSPFQRTYMNQIKRCGEMARKLRFFREQMSKAGVSPSVMFLSCAHIDLDELKLKLGDLEPELIEVNTNNEKVQQTYNELSEYLLVLKELVLLFLALVSVPWILLPKPLLLKKQHQERHQGQSYAMLQITDADMLEVELDHGSLDHEEFEFIIVFAHQLIHTIEFVLNAVSNTASYQ